MASLLAGGDPETVTYELDRTTVPKFNDDVVMKDVHGNLVKRPIINTFVQFSDKTIEHPVLTGNMGSGKTRETMEEVNRRVKDGVNVVLLPRRKLAVNQQRAYAAVYGRGVAEGRIRSLLPDSETRELKSQISSLDSQIEGAERSGNMDVAAREQLLARLGQAYVVYSKADKHVGYKNVKAIADRGIGTVIGLPKQLPMIAKLLESSKVHFFINDELKCLTQMFGTKVLNDQPSFVAMQKIAGMAKRLFFLDADFFLGSQPLDFAHFLLMGRTETKDRVVIYKFTQVKPELKRDVALFHSSVPPEVEATWLSKMNSRLQQIGKPMIDSCGTAKHFEFLLRAIKVFMQSAAGKDSKVWCTCSSRKRANDEARDALRARLKATAYTTNTDTQRAHDEMKNIDEFFSKMQFITASSTIDVGIDSIVHFPFIIAITAGGTSLPSSHVQALYRVSRIKKMEFTVLWLVNEPMPPPDRPLSKPNANLTLDPLAGKAAWHASAGTGTMPVHPKLMSIVMANHVETHWNKREHAVLVRETLSQNPCYTIIDPCDIKLPTGVFAITPRDISAMEDSYIDVSPQGVAHLFATARDVALEVSDPLERHKHALQHFDGCVANLMLNDPTLSEDDARHVVLADCNHAVEDFNSDPQLAKLDAPTLESCLLDTWSIVRYTGLGIDAAVVNVMDRDIDKYVLGVASLKGHLATEHYVMTLQMQGVPKGKLSVGMYNDLANKVRLTERASELLRVPQLVPTSAEHVIFIPDVMINRVNRLLRFKALPADSLWFNELSACARGVSDKNAVRGWSESRALSMLEALTTEVGCCVLNTESRPLTPDEQEEFTAAMLRREGLDGDEGSSLALPLSPQTAPESANDDFATLFAMEEEPPPAAETGVDRGAKRLEIIKRASEVRHYTTIGIRLWKFEYTSAGGKVAKGATRIEQENDVGETRVVLSAEKEESRKRRNASKKAKRESKRREAGGGVDSADAPAEEADALVVDTNDALSSARAAAATYNAQFLGGDDDDDGVSVSGASVSTSHSTRENLTPEDRARAARRMQAKRDANASCKAAAEAEVAHLKGTSEYESKLAAAKRRLKPDYQPTEIVANFDDDSNEIKSVCPFLLMNWTSTLTCKQESPFSTPSLLLDEKAKQVLTASLRSGYGRTQHALEYDPDAEADFGEQPQAETRIGQLQPHKLEDGYEAMYELYPLEKTTKLLAAAKGCETETANVKELFSGVINMPVKMRVNYETTKIINVLEMFAQKGTPDWENNTLKVPVTYRPGNAIAGVSRSYASYPSTQNSPNPVRIALMGPHLHDMDIAVALPTCAVIGLVMAGEDPGTVWPIGCAYLKDRLDGIASGHDEKRFQQEIVTHYQDKITLDDSKELLHIAMNDGRFEYYLERDHGIRTDLHSPALIQMRDQTNRSGGLRDILLENGEAICGSGNFTRLREDVYTRKNYASTSTIYTDGARPNDSEKAKRTLFALMLHTIERRVMRVCVDVAQEMKLVPFSSIFDGLQIIHPRVDDWVGKLEAYRRECHDRLFSKFNTHVYLIEKPFYITGVAHPDGDNMDSDGGVPALDPQEEAFGKLLQSAYGV